MSEIKIVEFEQGQESQSVSIDELSHYISSGSELSSFHDSLPDELQRALVPFAKGSRSTYVNALKAQLKSEKWTAIKGAGSNVAAPAYKSAYYPNFHHEPKLSSSQTTVTDTEIDKRPELEYAFELSCNIKAFREHVGWDSVLTKAGDEPNNRSWNEEATESGVRLNAKTKVDVPRALAFSSKGASVPLSIPNIIAKPKDETPLDEAIMAIMPAVQFGERLGLPTQGYYYHFNEGKLVQEYQIIGKGNCRFCLTYSDEHSLSDELRPTAWQSAIPVHWRVKGQLLDNQHLLYLPSKLSQKQLNTVDAAWLDEHGLALNIAELIDAGLGHDNDNERLHAPLTSPYEHPGRLLHGTEIVAINSPNMVAKGIPIVNLRPEKLFRIGVFFDGTGNNDKNDAYKEVRGNKSRSNVARLFAAYPQIQGESAKLYISGVGTVDIKDDSERPVIIDAQKDETQLEQAFGVNAKQTFGGDFQAALAFGFNPGAMALLNYVDGENGAFYKWQSLLGQLRREIELMGEEYDSFTHIVFDVIGFSRGAALSRHFVNALYQGLPDYTKPVSGKLKDVTITPHLLGNETHSKFSSSGGYERDNTKGVSVRFLGLFDTVASFYLAGNDNEGNFQLGIEPTMATTVLQLTAEHEYRKNFPLTSLARDNWLPSNFYQECFPGCHSDVGGGYPSIEQYEKEGLPEYVGSPTDYTYNRQLIKTEPLIAPYLGPGHDRAKEIQAQLDEKSAAWKRDCLAQYGDHGEVKLHKGVFYFYHYLRVSNAIAGVSLERMKQQSEAAGIVWTEVDYIQNLTPDYKTDTFCQELWRKLSEKPLGTITACDWQSEITPNFDEYIHRSHDTVINPPYKTLMETIVSSITTDIETGEKPERRIWDNV
nr:DUF2235 domain-containing protein [Vibrio mexicanus]